MSDVSLGSVEPGGEPGRVVTTDFRTAGFLHGRGVPFKGASQNDACASNDAGEAVFTFEGDAASLQALVGAYPGSPEARYDTGCRMMNGFLRALGTRKRGR